MGWAEPFRRMGVRANADIPRDALQARAFGAEGIGSVPHRAHVLRGRPSAAHAHHDSRQQRKGPPHRAAQAAAHAAQRLHRCLPLHGRLPGDHPHHRSAAARVPAAPRRPDGRHRQAGTDQAEIAQAEGVAHAAESRRAVARGQSHARPAGLPPGYHVPGNHGDAGRVPSSRPRSRSPRKA